MFKRKKKISKNISISQAHIDNFKKHLNEKGKFYELMQYYFDNSMVREIYSTEYYCLLSFGEIFYMICPYMIENDVAIGIVIDTDKLDEFIVKEDLMIMLIFKAFLNIEKYQRIIQVMGSSEEDKTLLKNFIKEQRAKGITNIDYDLEKRIKVNDMDTKPNLNNNQEPPKIQNKIDISNDFENKIGTAAFWKKQMPRAIIILIVNAVLNFILRFLPDSMILLLVIGFLCSSGATVYFIITVVSYFKITKKVMINLELFDDCDISYDDAIEELKSATMIDDDIGYTERFLILPQTNLIPFDSMVGMQILNDTFETVIYVDGKRRKFSMRVMRKKIDYKIEKILNLNKAKLSPYFKLEIGQVDYSE